MSDPADEPDPGETSVNLLAELIKHLVGSLKKGSMQKQEMFLGYSDFPFICEISLRLKQSQE